MSESRNIQSNKKPLKGTQTSPFKVVPNDISNPNESPLINKPTSFKTDRARTHSRSHSHNSPSYTSSSHLQHYSSSVPRNVSETPNWTTLIPPLPTYPQAAYKYDRREAADPQVPVMPPTTQSVIPPAIQSATQLPNKFTNSPLHNTNKSKPRMNSSVGGSPVPSSGVGRLQHQQAKNQGANVIKQRHSIAVSPSIQNQYGSNNTTPPLGVNSTRGNNTDFMSHVLNHDKNTFHENEAPKAPTQEIPPFAKSKNLSRESLERQPLQRTASQSYKKSVRKKRKVCKGCGKDITGQFVRALNSAFHVECFRCSECGKQCSAKFFPYDVIDEPSGIKYQVALCEYDYFKKLDLICHNCDTALRGPYITALGHKYHLEHFKCSICQTVFESDESYYEHEGDIYCHYHYSKLFATHCEGCHSPIVKQFVELFRGGRNQQWHPECYMVHKFWSVCILADSVGLESRFGISNNDLDMKNLKDSNLKPDLLVHVVQHVENTIMSCWLTLSGYEETTAACISDMLMNACTSNVNSGLAATGKLIVSVEILFQALDLVQVKCAEFNLQPIGSSTSEEDESHKSELMQPLRKEPRNISGKIMSYLAILRKSKQISISGSLSTELLSVITGCAHYLKLMIRIGLHNALKVNKIKGSTEALDGFLAITKQYNKFNDSRDAETEALIKERLTIPTKSTDLCSKCLKSIEKSCVKFERHRWHFKCLECSNCNKTILPLEKIISQSTFNTLGNLIHCEECSVKEDDKDFVTGFEMVSDLSQLVYLLKIALLRSRSVMLMDQTREKEKKNSSLSQLEREAESDSSRNAVEDDYSKTLDDVTRMRMRRQSQRLSSTKKNARKSVILEAPEADKAKEYVTNEEGIVEEGSQEDLTNKDSPIVDRKTSSSSQLSFITQQQDHEHFNVLTRNKKSLKIKDEPQKQLHLDRTSDLLQNEKSLTLDDIPRIVAAEQAREQRPNAFKHHKSQYLSQKRMHSVRTVAAANGSASTKFNPDSSKIGSSKQTGLASSKLSENGDDNVEKERSGPVQFSEPKLKYYSELDKSQHFILRHIAIEALLKLLNNKYNKEELLGLIQTKKQTTFWDKFKFNAGGDGKKDKSIGVFGVDLQDLTNKYGVDSDLGVGPSKLRIPIVVDDVIQALRQKDMSVEGIFRLNGNIKKLKDLTEQINKNPLKSPDFSAQTAVQLAALMKKWLRELPNPLLTYNLYDIWISSQRHKDPTLQKRTLQLVYCMLPRSHRNLVEVLLYFFSWVASFAEIDDETGSKMDIHNLATVITPNILTAKRAQADKSPQSGDNYFLAIEVVNQLIEIHEELATIPPDLLEFFDKCGFNTLPQGGKSPNISTKEILAKVEKVLKDDPNFFANFDLRPSTTQSPRLQEEVSNKIAHGHSKVVSEAHGESVNV